MYVEKGVRDLIWILSVSPGSGPIGLSLVGPSDASDERVGIFVTKVKDESPCKGIIRAKSRIYSIDGTDVSTQPKGVAVTLIKAAGSVIEFVTSDGPDVEGYDLFKASKPEDATATPTTTAVTAPQGSFNPFATDVPVATAAAVDTSDASNPFATPAPSNAAQSSVGKQTGSAVLEEMSLPRDSAVLSSMTASRPKSPGTRKPTRKSNSASSLGDTQCMHGAPPPITRLAVVRD